MEFEAIEIREKDCFVGYLYGTARAQDRAYCTVEKLLGAFLEALSSNYPSNFAVARRMRLSVKVLFGRCSRLFALRFALLRNI